jgi:transcriptional regulator with XRE-family HTH domain
MKKDKNPRSTSDIDKLIGANLKLIRQQADQSTQYLSKTIGVSRYQMQKYENGENRLSAARLYAIASHFKVQVGDFFEARKGDQ